MLKGLLIGLGTSAIFLSIRFLFWKDKVPNWLSNFRWLIGFILGVIGVYLYYLLGGEIKGGILIIAAICLAIGYGFKNESSNKQ